MSVALAVPCGLILYEIVTNAVRHALAGARRGEIRLGLHRTPNGSCLLSVADDGSGLPPQFDAEDSPSPGLRLIRSLTRQIGGRFELVPAFPGTEARLTVRLEQHVS